MQSPRRDRQFSITNSSDSLLEFRVLTDPGVGTANSFTRRIEIALSGRDVARHRAVSTHSACHAAFDRFPLDSPPPGVSIGRDSSVVDSTTCYFEHILGIPWGAFRNSSLGMCGFAESGADGTSTSYAGRLFVNWEDYYSMEAIDPVRTKKEARWVENGAAVQHLITDPFPFRRIQGTM